MKCGHSNSKLFEPCPACGVLAEPEDSGTEYFRLFGVEPRYFIDLDIIQREFYSISKILHPDRFHGKSNFEAATHWFAIVNKALLTLKSPEARAEYLFRLAHYVPPKTKQVLPPILAEEYFDLQESLENSAISESEKKKQLGEFSKKIEIQKGLSNEARDEAFKDWEKSGAPLGQAAIPFFERASREINQKNYLDSMANDLRRSVEK